MPKEGPIAIIIAVENYRSDELASLPACLRDGQAIERVVMHTGRFSQENIFKAFGTVTSDTLKSDLTNFFATWSNWNVDEVFFYFSGHGDYTANEFYYLLSDYDGKRLRQTSLEGTELDNLIRNIHPQLYVKIVDACHSGLRYIKSREDFDQYVTKFSSSFNRLYFMFLSLADQFSYSGKDLSRFTRNLVKAIIDTTKEKMRYKDLIDAVSDAMVAAGQTPYFVTQAQFTEIFCNVDVELKGELSKLVSDLPIVAVVGDKGEADGLYKLITDDAARYATHDEAKEALTTLAELFSDYKSSEELARFYEFSVSTSTKALNHFKGIGTWLEQDISGEQYFAEPTYLTRSRTKRVPLSGFSSTLNLVRGKILDTKRFKKITNLLPALRVL